MFLIFFFVFKSVFIRNLYEGLILVVFIFDMMFCLVMLSLVKLFLKLLVIMILVLFFFLIEIVVLDVVSFLFLLILVIWFNLKLGCFFWCRWFLLLIFLLIFLSVKLGINDIKFLLEGNMFILIFVDILIFLSIKIVLCFCGLVFDAVLIGIIVIEYGFVMRILWCVEEIFFVGEYFDLWDCVLLLFNLVFSGFL